MTNRLALACFATSIGSILMTLGIDRMAGSAHAQIPTVDAAGTFTADRAYLQSLKEYTVQLQIKQSLLRTEALLAKCADRVGAAP